MITDADIDRACHRLLTSEDYTPLLEWWQLQLSNAMIPPLGQVDPLRLAMSQGDRERLLAIKRRAEAHRKRMEQT